MVHGTNHASETALDEDYKVDIKINNVGSLDDLKKSAEEAALFLLQLEKIKD